MYININLLPKSYYEAKKAKQQKIIFISAGITFVAILGILYSIQFQQVRSIQAEINKITNEGSQYDKELTKIEEIRKSQEFLKNRLKVIDDLLIRQEIWPAIMTEISRAVPNTLWITSMLSSPSGTGKMFTIDGTALSKNSVAKFIDNLQSSQLFEDVKLEQVIEKPVLGIRGATYKLTFLSKI